METKENAISLHKKLEFPFKLPMREMYDKLIDDFNEFDLKKATDEELKNFMKYAIRTRYAVNSVQVATKISMAAIYGASGTPIFPYFSNECAADTCSEGRYYCKLMNTVANKYVSQKWAIDYDFHKELEAQPFAEKLGIIGKKPTAIDVDLGIYGDTDSVYIEFGFILESYGLNVKRLDQKAVVDFIVYFSKHKFNVIFNAVLEKSLTSRNVKNTMNFELEMIGSAGIFIVAKKYIIPIIWEDEVYVAERGKLKSKGIELVQNSSSAYVKDIMRKFINALFTDETLDDRKFFRLCQSVKESARQRPMQDLCKVSNLQKFDELVIEWQNKIQLTKGAGGNVLGGARYNHLVFKHKLFNKYEYIKSGSRVFWYYAEDGKPFSYPEGDAPLEILPKMDIDMQLEKLVFAPIKRIAEGKFKSSLAANVGKNNLQFSFNISKIKKQ